jgi:hypothetical protein
LADFQVVAALRDALIAIAAWTRAR